MHCFDSLKVLRKCPSFSGYLQF
uniref:Uncharacterized protein n=1 Tax=Rhizophora mucronata TaxID=61149 RepID=A0A2P2R418_RHIMU